jgi:hypothetical protein
MLIKFILGILKGSYNLEVLGGYRKIILKWILRNYDVTVWNGFNWLRVWSRGGLL